MQFYFYKNIPVLVYHKISNDFEYGLTTVRIQEFRDQMQYLFDHNYQTVGPDSYLSKITTDIKPIILCFDDAYESVFQNAFPIMKSYNFSGLLFPVSDFIGRENNWDVHLGGRVYKHADIAQILDMLNHGWNIACHSAGHNVKRLKKQFSAEIVQSKLSLESIFKIKVNSFAYPFTYKIEQIADKVEKEFDYIFTMISSRLPTAKNIHRVPIYRNDSLKSFEKKIKLDKLTMIQTISLQKASRLTIAYQQFFK